MAIKKVKPIKLGDVVIDQITLYRGTVTALAVYLHAADLAFLESIDTTGRPIQKWVELTRLKVQPE